MCRRFVSGYRRLNVEILGNADAFLQVLDIGARTAAFATADRRGQRGAAIVDLGVQDDGTLLFQTKVSSRKVRNLSVTPCAAATHYGQPMSNERLSRDQFVLFVRAAKLAVVATVDRASKPEAAVLEVAALGDGQLIFISEIQDRKVRNLTTHTRVAIVSGWDPITLQIEGEAELLLGIEREAMVECYREQIPGRPIPAEDFALYRVVPDWVRYVEARDGQLPIIAEGLPE